MCVCVLCVLLFIDVAIMNTLNETVMMMVMMTVTIIMEE